MSHYDCSNCGEYGGIAFGYCRSCTPLEYTNLENERREILNKIETEVNDLLSSYKATLKELLKTPHENRLNFIQKRMDELRENRY